jgi:hypothetical protein
MSDFSATDVAFSGIRFVRERPRTVAIWAGAQIIVSLVLGAIVVSMMGPYLAQLQSFSRQTPADPTQVMATFSHIAPAYALLLPLSLLINAVIYAAMARAVLRPADEGVGYLRLGADEVRQILLMLLWIVVAFAGEIIGGIVLAIPTVILMIVAKGATPLIMFLCILVALAAIIYCIVRLSLASALTFDSRRVDLFGSWTLTKGHVGKMIGAYALVVVLALVIVILVSIIGAAVGAVLGGIGGMAAVFSGNVGSIADFFAPARLAMTVIWAIVTPLFWALFLMPPAEIYRHLSGAADPALDPATFD